MPSAVAVVSGDVESWRVVRALTVEEKRAKARCRIWLIEVQGVVGAELNVDVCGRMVCVDDGWMGGRLNPGRQDAATRDRKTLDPRA